MIPRRVTTVALCSAAAVAVASGCASRAPAPERPRLGGDVVAVVNESAIRRGELERYAELHGTSAREALTALEDDALLADDAARRGLRIDETYLRKRLLVQLLLRRIEREHGPESLTDAQIEPFREPAREALRREATANPPPPPEASEVERRAIESAVIALRRDAVNRVIVAGRQRVTIEYREATVRDLFGRDALFGGIR